MQEEAEDVLALHFFDLEHVLKLLEVSTNFLKRHSVHRLSFLLLKVLIVVVSTAEKLNCQLNLPLAP